MRVTQMLLWLTICFVGATTHGGEWDMGTVQNEITDLKRRVDIAEEEIKTLKANWDMGLSKSADPEVCPCPTGGKCICPADACDCPNCPEHGPGEFDRVRILAFGADWCANCPAADAQAKAAGVWQKVFHYDVDKPGDKRIADRLGVTSLPALVLVKDEKPIRRFSGLTGYAGTIQRWLSEIPSLASRNEPVRASQPKDDFRPVRISRSSPAFAYASTGYNPVQRCTVNRLHPQHWTWPGDLGSHLRQAHGFNPAGFSHSQLVTIHDNFHNTGRSGASGGYRSSPPVVTRPVFRPMQFLPRVMSSGSFCPTCPH